MYETLLSILRKAVAFYTSETTKDQEPPLAGLTISFRSETVTCYASSSKGQMARYLHYKNNE